MLRICLRRIPAVTGRTLFQNEILTPQRHAATRDCPPIELRSTLSADAHPFE
jgi:hypothetical protein